MFSKLHEPMFSFSYRSLLSLQYKRLWQLILKSVHNHAGYSHNTFDSNLKMLINLQPALLFHGHSDTWTLSLGSKGLFDILKQNNLNVISFLLLFNCSFNHAPTCHLGINNQIISCARYSFSVLRVPPRQGPKAKHSNNYNTTSCILAMVFSGRLCRAPCNSFLSSVYYRYHTSKGRTL